MYFTSVAVVKHGCKGET